MATSFIRSPVTLDHPNTGLRTTAWSSHCHQFLEAVHEPITDTAHHADRSYDAAWLLWQHL